MAAAASSATAPSSSASSASSVQLVPASKAIKSTKSDKSGFLPPHTYVLVQDELLSDWPVVLQYTKFNPYGPPIWDCCVAAELDRVGVWRWDTTLGLYVLDGYTDHCGGGRVWGLVLPVGMDNPAPSSVLLAGTDWGNVYTCHVNGPTPKPVSFLYSPAFTLLPSIDSRWDIILWSLSVTHGTGLPTDFIHFQGLTHLPYQHFWDHMDWIMRSWWNDTPALNAKFSCSYDMTAKYYFPTGSVTYTLGGDFVPIYWPPTPPSPPAPYAYGDTASLGSIHNCIVALATDTGEVQMYDWLLGPMCFQTFQTYSRIYQIAHRVSPYDANTTLVACACEDGLHIYSTNGNFLIQELFYQVNTGVGHPMRCLAVAYAAEANKLMTVWEDFRMRWFELV